MKKTSIIAVALFIAALSFTSCKKDYHCQCSLNGNTVSNTDLGTMTHRDAVNKCNSYDNVGGNTYSCSVE